MPRAKWIPGLALLAALQAVAGAPSAGRGSEPAVPPEAERRVASLVREWFTRLETRAPQSPSPERLLSAPSFELSTAEGTARTRAAVRAWLDDLRTPHPRVAFQLAAMRIAPVEADLYRARFEVDRRTYDLEELPHVSRWEHTWLVRSVPGEPPVIVRIEERPSLSHPGTGTRIICN